MYICYNCGSDETYKKQWYKYNEYKYCKKCYNKIILNPKWHPITHKKWNPITNPKWNIRKIGFKGKQIILDENPRKGICKNCGAVKGIDCERTSLHHMKYHEDDVLKDTIELCNSCHRKKHRK